MEQRRRWAEDAIVRSARRITDHATRMQIRSRYEDDEETAAEIGAALGISAATVLNVLRSLGVHIRPPVRRAGRLRSVG